MVKKKKKKKEKGKKARKLNIRKALNFANIGTKKLKIQTERERGFVNF